MSTITCVCGYQWVSRTPRPKKCPRCQRWQPGWKTETGPGVTLNSGEPVTPDDLEIDPATGMQRGYPLLSLETEEERAKGYMYMPAVRSYVHLRCGTTTTMHESIAETYARAPKFVGGTLCVSCQRHFPFSEFVWEGTDQKVGT